MYRTVKFLSVYWKYLQSFKYKVVTFNAWQPEKSLPSPSTWKKSIWTKLRVSWPASLATDNQWRRTLDPVYFTFKLCKSKYLSQWFPIKSGNSFLKEKKKKGRISQVQGTVEETESYLCREFQFIFSDNHLMISILESNFYLQLITVF